MIASKGSIFLQKTLLVCFFAFTATSCSDNRQQLSHERANASSQQTAPPTSQETAVVSDEIPIWSASIPDAVPLKDTETYNDGMVRDVSVPTIKVFSPVNYNTGVAVIVFPGGGYNKLAIDLEGSEICKWLASIGVTGILLKYRVPASGPHYDKACECEKDPVKPYALQDAQRAMGLVRARAGDWDIDPKKIGVMGFSAGGHLVADIGTNYRKRVYDPADAIDTTSCKPNFGIVMFPGHMTFHTSQPYTLNRTLPVDSQTPPMFLLQAGNDNIDTIQNSLVYYIALKKAGVHAEYHVYAEGGHAFGLNESAQKIPGWTDLPIADWEILVERWLHTIHML